MRSSINLEFNKLDLKMFNAACEAKIRNVDRGTKRLTTEACQTILADSLEQVPKRTSTLAASGYYEVKRRGDTARTTWAYEGIVGYGGNGNPINPETGMRASNYMVKVHEDLSVVHPNGKAKFLEDAVRAYGETQLINNAMREWKADIEE